LHITRVSKNDRKARIELGTGWGREKDDLCRRIMDEYIVPKFKEGDFSGGIVLGVESLAKMAQGLQLPMRPRPWWHYALVVGAVGLGIFTVISLIRRGSGGWAWLLWGRGVCDCRRTSLPDADIIFPRGRWLLRWIVRWWFFWRWGRDRVLVSS
jgi:uncharacterized membrane protein YgcG